MKAGPVARGAAVLAMALLSGCGILGGDGKKSRTPVVGERLPVLAYEGLIEADPGMAGLPVELPPAVHNESWTQPGGNAQKSVGHVETAATLSEAWRVSIGKGNSNKARLASSPVVDGGRVFTIDTTAEVRAFDAATGRPVWSHQISLDNESSRLAFGGGVSTAGGRVFASTGYGIVEALDAATGQRAWRVNIGVPLRGAPAVADDRLFVISQDNQMFALSLADGTAQWDMAATVETSGLFGAATPAVSQGTVVAGFSSGELLALRVENGRVVWQDALARTGISTSVATLSDIDASPVIDGGQVFAIGKGGRMAGLELNTGQRIWEVNIAGTSTPAVAGDWLFVVTDDAKVVCVARNSGRVRWISQLPAFRDEEDRKGPISWAGPVVTSNRLALVSSRGTMVFVSPTDGEIQTTVKLPSGAYLPPVVANKTLYVLTEDGRLSAWR